jgi:hypothetical protein
MGIKPDVAFGGDYLIGHSAQAFLKRLVSVEGRDPARRKL